MIDTLEAVDFGWRATRVLACLCALDTTLPLLHVAVVVAVLVVELGFGEPLFVPLLRTGTEDINGNSWVQVAMRGTTSGKL